MMRLYDCNNDKSTNDSVWILDKVDQDDPNREATRRFQVLNTPITTLLFYPPLARARQQPVR